MSAEYLAAAAGALWAGVLTSVSPCPLATNITALTFISSQSGQRKAAVFLHGLLYALGRALAYTAVGFLVVKSLISAPAFSFFMQKYGGQVLSPILVLAGMYFLGLLGAGFGGFNVPGLARFKDGSSSLASLLMGAAFALAFCPVSAALYFGVVMPLAAGLASPFFVPMLYGLGTALPVIGMAVALDFGLAKIGAVAALAGKFSGWAKPATGWVFIGAGVYLGLKYIFGVV